MPRCSKCNKDWPATMTSCPDDGWSLTMGVDATVMPTNPGRPGGATAAQGHALAVAPPPPQHELPPAPDGSDLLAGTRVGEYVIEKKIGEGGMGAVYGAVHPMIGKKAAIKVISSALGTDASAVGRFVQEARSVNQIGHPNIVDVFAFGELPDGRNYFVMEHLQGESLADRIARAPMSLGEAIEILDQVCDALDAAHEKQIVHRDLKPDNVYLSAVRGGRTMVKLLDFGIAKLSTPDGEGTGGGIAKTRTGMMMGTPGYISPEQARGKNVDHRTDVYALGCMAFEIVCGRLPFVADNAMDIVLMHMTAQAPRASEVWADVPPPLEALIGRMLEKDPNLRPTMAETRALFAELVTSGLVTVSNTRGSAFGSSIGRFGTPPPGEAPSAVRAIGTHPAAAAPITTPPTQRPPTLQPATGGKKTGLVIGLVFAVALIGGGAAFFATRGGGDDTPQKEPAIAAAEPPKAEPPKVEPPKVEATVAKPGTIEIRINADKASVTVDGTPVAVTGRMVQVPVDKEGMHTVAVTAPGREPFEQQVEVKSGASVEVIAKLERAKSGAKKPAGKGDKKPGGKGVKKPGGTGDKNYTVDPFAN